MLEQLLNLDDRILLAVNGLHSPIFDVIMWQISSRAIWIPLYIFLVYLLYRNLGWRKTLLWTAGVALVIVLADQACAHGLRQIFCRLRPANPDNPISPFVHIVNDYRAGKYGFPSAHAGNTWALVAYLGWILRKRALTCALAGWAALVCYSRMYLGVHYLGDLLAGMIVGVLCATLVYFLISYADKRFHWM